MKRFAYLVIGILALFCVLPSVVHSAGTVTLSDPYPVKPEIWDYRDSGIKMSVPKEATGCFAIDATLVTGGAETAAADATKYFTVSGEIVRVEVIEQVEGDITETCTLKLLNPEGVDVLNSCFVTTEVNATMTSSANSRCPLDDDGYRIQLWGRNYYWSAASMGNSNTMKVRILFRPIR